MLWSFWIACGLAVTGAILPLLLAAGGSNRIAGAAVPFGVGAAALAGAALLYHQGRPVATALYFIAGLALVYGMLAMIAVPLRLAVIGTCDPAPAICLSGVEPPMSGGEDSGLAIGVAMGTLAILVGFFGLLMLFRIRPQATTAPPTRIVKPWVPPTTDTAVSAVTEPEPAPAVVEPEPSPAVAAAASAEGPVAPIDGAAAPSKARKPRVKRAPKPQAELAAPAEPLELPAPEEPLELPAPPPASEASADTDPAS
ncbi:MAG TPA: hypothetical protein VIP57_17035 [Candidatus Dormibacteraeota bacterium]